MKRRINKTINDLMTNPRLSKHFWFSLAGLMVVALLFYKEQ